MPACPFCGWIVSVTPRGRHIYPHNVPTTNRKCRAAGLTIEGAQDYLKLFPQSNVGVYDEMGMFDKPQYLTAKELGAGYVDPGDTFWIHNARIDGTSTVGGAVRDQAKLLVSKTRDGETSVVYTSGTGIVGQIKRMDADDRAAMPMEVRLDQVPSGKGNPTNVLTPAAQEPPSQAAEEDIPF